jgi:hypothetical protein
LSTRRTASSTLKRGVMVNMALLRKTMCEKALDRRNTPHGACPDRVERHIHERRSFQSRLPFPALRSARTTTIRRFARRCLIRRSVPPRHCLGAPGSFGPGPSGQLADGSGEKPLTLKLLPRTPHLPLSYPTARNQRRSGFPKVQ